MKKKVIRINCEELDKDDCQAECLRGIYGEDVIIVTETVEYGADPAITVEAIVRRHEIGCFQVVAIELKASFMVLASIVSDVKDVDVIRWRWDDDEEAYFYEKLLPIKFPTERL